MAWVPCDCENPWCTRCDMHAFECACESELESVEPETDIEQAVAPQLLQRHEVLAR